MRRTDSPYTDDTHCPYPEGGLGQTGPAPEYLAQNEGQRVHSTGLHLPQSTAGSPQERGA